MSQHFLATLFVLVSLAAIGLFVLAMMLTWRDRQAARQHALEQQRQLAALRVYHRHAERQIDQISRAAIQHMVTLAHRNAQGIGQP